MNSHNDFILSPITLILEDVTAATAGINNGIETYPLCDYIMQSIFLRMTGFQEQKIKCICWELATIDYEYRYKRYTRKPLGECSRYNEKKTIYKDIIEQIKNRISGFDVSIFIDRAVLLKETISFIKDTFVDTNISLWAQNSSINFIKDSISIEPTDFGTNDDLFVNTLQNKYTLLYNHRNRCAHNTLSYQQNLPTLKTLARDDYKYDNYFAYFTILILIDKIFIKLYGKYLEVIEDKL